MLGAAAIGLAAVATPLASAAQKGQEPEVDAMDKQLAKPLSPEAKKLLKDALKGIETSAKDRLKTKLPENSEPCFTYFPSTREVRTK
jgi:hypothetical protein